MTTIAHILVPTDGSQLSLQAATRAAGLARDLKAKITALYVMEPWMPRMQAEGTVPVDQSQLRKDFLEHTSRQADEALAIVSAEAARQNVACDALRVTNDQPWAGIVKAADAQRCDLIVMASHGRRGLEALVLGSETNKVLTHSKTPVLVCR
jgi:nucleotide-binding universal stress UspA family protein